MKIAEKLKELIKKEKKLAFIIIAGAVGITLILLSELLPEESESTQTRLSEETSSSYESETEERLTQIISKIDGVGEVSVMVTFSSDGVYEYATNGTSDEKTQEDSSEKKQENEYVVISGVNGDECVLVRSENPEVLGVVVVCTGGDNQTVKNNVTSAVSSLLGVGAKNITVVKMKENG